MPPTSVPLNEPDVIQQIIADPSKLAPLAPSYEDDIEEDEEDKFVTNREGEERSAYKVSLEGQEWADESPVGPSKVLSRVKRCGGNNNNGNGNGANMSRRSQSTRTTRKTKKAKKAAKKAARKAKKAARRKVTTTTTVIKKVVPSDQAGSETQTNDASSVTTTTTTTTTNKQAESDPAAT